MTLPVIRRAGPKDAETLSAIARATFEQAFGGLYPRADLEAYLDQAYELDKTRATLADSACAAWLAEADGRAVGHALAGPCALPHPEVTAGCGQLKRIYVLRAWRGGLGSQLMQTALAWLERDGPRRIWLGVWSGNHGALRLYQRMGFAKVGDYEFAVGGVRDHELILRRG